MKRTIISILILATTFISLGFNNFSQAYYADLNIQPTNQGNGNIEKHYVELLESISNQLYILSSNALNTITDKKDVAPLLKDVAYIKTQIRNLRSELGEYHKTESGNIEKNPLSLSLLNTLNYYSMSLSYLQGFLESTSALDASDYLEKYYTSKGSGDQLLLRDKEEIEK